LKDWSVLPKDMSEASSEVEVKTDLLKYAMYGNIVVMLLIIGQAMTGLGRLGYTFDGWDLISSHKYTGHLGLMLTLGILVLVIISKHDGKLKGMSIGLFAMWVMQFGLGEMMGAGKTWLGMVHAPLAVMMFAHAAMMMNKFKEAFE
jgi:hypothetical protein